MNLRAWAAAAALLAAAVAFLRLRSRYAAQISSWEPFDPTT